MSIEIPSEYSHLEIEGGFKEALEKAVEGKNLLITGSAGCGKSMLLKILNHPEVIGHSKTVTLASTGLAGSLIGGQTMHSFFKFPIYPITESDADGILNRISKDEAKIKVYQNIKTLVIDEISMIKPYHLDVIDKILRLVKNPTLPFGNVQILLFGDLFQLAPIVNQKEEKDFLKDLYGGIPYFFSSNAFLRGRFETVELNKVYRQIGDPKYADVLNKIRIGEQSQEDVDFINEKAVCDELDFFDKHEDFVYLASNNAKVADINNQSLDVNDNPLMTFQALYSGEFPKELRQIEETMRVKVDCQLMLILNQPKINKVNGSLCLLMDVVEAGEDREPHFKVKFTDGAIEYIPMVDFNTYKFNYNKESQEISAKIDRTVRQFPFKLAYSLTIHKSQGMTLDKTYLDLGERNAFAKGMTYVALSRVRNLSDLGLARPLRMADIKVSETVKKLYEDAKES